MKITINGDTPMERLVNLTKRVASVDKAEIAKLERKWLARKRPKTARKRR
jgi:hypothetical protein